MLRDVWRERERRVMSCVSGRGARGERDVRGEREEVDLMEESVLDPSMKRDAIESKGTVDTKSITNQPLK